MKYKGIIFMKIGYHVDEEINEIIRRKLKEEKDNSYFFGDMEVIYAIH